MGFYSRYIEPALVSLACQTPPITHMREAVVPHAHGRILEVGFGSGLNLRHYAPTRVEHLFALEPNEGMRRRARRRVDRTPFPIEFLDLPGEEIPLDDASVDSVLITFTMCTIPDVEKAIGGMRRVLKPGGRLYFCEHGRAPDPRVAKWQDRLNPLWGRVAGGCNLNRKIDALIAGGGFDFDELSRDYVKGAPKFAGFMYWGAAHAR